MDTSPHPLISIIMPVFNSGKYLEISLKSIISQTYTNWECIIVDDGSTDNSKSICDKYEKIDSRFHVINSSKGGVSRARNIGIKASKGSFISFIDSDDWVEEQFLEVLYNTIKRYNADVVQCGFRREYQGFHKDKSLVKEITEIKDSSILEELLKNRIITSYIWNKLYRRDTITDLFPPGKVFEDIYALTCWFEKISTIVLIPDILYHYRMRKGSIMNSDYAKNRLDYFDACRHRIKTLAHQPIVSLPQNNQDIFLINAAIEAAKSIARQEKNYTNRNKAITLLAQNLGIIGNPGIKSLGYKKWFRRHLILNNPHLFVLLMKISYFMDFHARFRDRNLYD